LQNLLDVDLYRYDEAWEVEPEKLNLQFGSIILDLRTPLDFSQWHLPAAANVPLNSLDSTTPSPFFDSTTLEKVWKELESLFSSTQFAALNGRDVIVACYDGDVSRVATSVLRNRGVNASSIKGGIRGLEAKMPPSPRIGDPPHISLAGYETNPSAKLGALVSIAAVE
jgi:cysteine synthase A